MAEGKKSVLLYCDLIHTVEKMDDATAGQFFKHYLRYVNDLNPVAENFIVEIAFESVKQSLKRDLRKYEKRAECSRINGMKGGRPKEKEETQKTQQVISEPKKPDTVSVNDSVIVNDNDSVSVKKESVKKKGFPLSSLSSFDQVEFSDERKKDLFVKWMNYRKEIGKQIRAISTIQQLIATFNKEPFEKVDFTVNNSIQNGWQGLFWEKYESIKTNNNGKSEQLTASERNRIDSERTTARIMDQIRSDIERDQ